MCRVERFRSTTCPHKWMTIIAQCSPSSNFSNIQQNAHILQPVRNRIWDPEYVMAPPHTCPDCNMRGTYDGNMTRIILEPGQGGGLGNGYTMTDGHGNILPWGQYNGVPYTPLNVAGWGVIPTAYQPANNTYYYYAL